MYLILVKPFCMQSPTVSCGWNHDVPSFISTSLVSSKLYWTISLEHITVVAVFGGGGSETRWEINQLTVKEATTPPPPQCAWIVIVFVRMASLCGEGDDAKTYNPQANGGQPTPPPQSVMCSLCIMDALHSEMPCSSSRAKQKELQLPGHRLRVRACLRVNAAARKTSGVETECYKKKTYECLNGSASSGGEWKESDTSCGGGKSRKYLKRRKMKKKKKSCYSVKKKKEKETSQSTRDQPGRRKTARELQRGRGKKVPF